MAKKLKKQTGQTARKVIPILGIGIDSTGQVKALKRAWSLIARASEASSRLGKVRARLIVTPNPEIVSRAQSDLKLAQILNKADLALPDGIGIVAAAGFLNPSSKLVRVLGRLFAEELVQLCAKHNKKVFLLGGRPGAAKLAANNLIENSKLKIENLDYATGPWLDMDGKPTDNHEAKVEQELIKQINAFTPDLLLVGFGAPKQEKWLDKNLPKLKVGAAMVVGGMIDYTAGILPPAPRAFSDLGFEWLWKLFTQPSRVGRIFTATVVFPWQVFLYKLKKKNS